MPRVYAAIDVDGVVLDLAGYITERLGLDPALWTTWEFIESYPDPEVQKEVKRLFTEAPDMFVQAKPYEDARAGILKLLDADIDFCFMSSFPPEFIKLREWWLWYNLIHPLYSESVSEIRARVMCVYHGYKPRACSTYGITHILEDNRQTADACIEAGIKAYLVPRVYNRPAFDAPYVPDVTIDEFADIIIRETRGN